MSDPILATFLNRVRDDAARLPASRVLRLAADPGSGDPPHRYQALFSGLEHFERDETGAVVVSRQPLLFEILFPADYLRSTDGTLQFRVARARSRFLHPNTGPGGVVCLGSEFRSGTRLRPLVHQLWGIASGRNFATESPMDPQARDFFLDHVDRVRALRSEPLWEQPIAAAMRVEAGSGPKGMGHGHGVG